MGVASAGCGDQSDGGGAIFHQVQLTELPAEAIDGITHGIITRGGSQLGCEVIGMDATAVTFRRGSAPAQRKTVGEVSLLIYRPIAATTRERLGKGEAGVLMRNGDFMEGALQALDANQAKLRSVLLGARTLDLRREVSAIVLRPIAPAPAALEVTLFDGSILRAKAITVNGGGVAIEEVSAGTIVVEVRDVTEIRRRS
jgi:hypothetical protein